MHTVYIHSSGRSGSNRLLDIFDVHEQTHCRSELNGVDEEFRKLLSLTDRAAFTQRWL